MSRKLKGVEALPDQEAAETLLGFATDGAIDESVEEIAAVTELRRAAR
jgi:hypothetical protein